ncbi:MAG TPA: hypothetical protein VFV38_12160 [Ktedonobacteraceae bacterium]|nr:hypothetical protein [Ktedonobacteraceae bacterium]
MRRKRSTVITKPPWKILLGMFTLLCLLGLAACAGDETTARVYDNARVLNTGKVQRAAQNLPANVDVYTTNSFYGTPGDFQRTMVNRVGGDPDRIVMGIDAQHNYMYTARGSNIPLNSTNMVQSSNAFVANVSNGDYTRATVAALDSMGRSMNANSSPSPSVLPWLLPLLIIGGLLFFLFRDKIPRPAIQRQSHAGQPASTYQPPQNTGRSAEPTYQPPQNTGRSAETIHQPPQNAGRSAETTYRQPRVPERPRDEGTIVPPTPATGIRYGTDGSYTSGKDGTESTLNKDRTDYGTIDTNGGRHSAKSGADYGTTDTRESGRFGKGRIDNEPPPPKKGRKS